MTHYLNIIRQMKKIQNQPALAIVILGLLLGLSISKIYQQKLQINEFKKGATAFPVVFSGEVISIPEAPVALKKHEVKLEHETERITEEMARLEAELEAVRQAHDRLLDAHLRQFGTAQ